MANNLYILKQIKNERDRQIKKFSDKRPYSNLDWLAVLAEKFGEVAGDVCKREVPPEANNSNELRGGIKTELIQCAAVCVAWVEALDNGDVLDVPRETIKE